MFLHSLLVLLILLGIYCLFMPFYLKLGRLRAIIIPAGSSAIASSVAFWIFKNWGSTALFSYLAFLLLVSMVIRLFLARRKPLPGRFAR